MRKEEHWKIDKRVPFALIVTMLLQVAGALIWATQLDARVGNVEQQMVSDSSLSEKFARLDERLEGMKQNMDGIKRQLDKLTDKLIGK